MGRLTDLFSVNCTFFTLASIVLAIFVPLMLPGVNQPIINAIKHREYKILHKLVDTELARIETEMAKEPITGRWEGRKQAVIDDIDFGGGRSIMHLAAMHGDVPILRYLHKRGASIHVRKSEDFRTPLHLAATFGTRDVVDLLVKWGASVDARAHAGWTPLLLAVLLSNHDIVESLLASGADPNLSVDESFNSLSCALIYSDERMVFLLIKAGAYVEEGEPRYAAFLEHRQRILEAGLLKEEDIPNRNKMQPQPQKSAAQVQGEVQQRSTPEIEEDGEEDDS